MQSLFPWSWIISFYIFFLIYADAYFIISFFFRGESYSIVCIYHIFITQLSTERHLGNFHLLDIVTGAAMRPGKQVSVEEDVKSLGHMAGSVPAGSYCRFIFSFFEDDPFPE